MTAITRTNDIAKTILNLVGLTDKDIHGKVRHLEAKENFDEMISFNVNWITEGWFLELTYFVWNKLVAKIKNQKENEWFVVKTLNSIEEIKEAIGNRGKQSGINIEDVMKDII